MDKKFLYIIIALVLCSFASADIITCGQEFNNATTCGQSVAGQIYNGTGWNVGIKYWTTCFDGVWGASNNCAVANGAGNIATVNWTYIKPPFAVGMNWSVGVFPNTVYSIQNYTIPSDCWNYNTTAVKFNMRSVSIGVIGNGFSEYYCQNSSAGLGHLITNVTTGEFFSEENVTWTINTSTSLANYTDCEVMSMDNSINYTRYYPVNKDDYLSAFNANISVLTAGYIVNAYANDNMFYTGVSASAKPINSTLGSILNTVVYTNHCNCTNCSIVGDMCYVPLTFQATGYVNATMCGAVQTRGWSLTFNCSTSNRTANFLFCDENFIGSGAGCQSLNSNFEVEGLYSRGDIKVPFSQIISNSFSYDVCMDPVLPGFNVTMNYMYIQYRALQDNNISNRYFVVNKVLNGTRTDFTLYNLRTLNATTYTTSATTNQPLAGTISVPINVQNVNGINIPNVFVTLNRNYAGYNKWRDVQMRQTSTYDDFFVFYVYPYDIDYGIVVMDNNLNVIFNKTGIHFIPTDASTGILITADFDNTGLNTVVQNVNLASINALYDNNTQSITTSYAYAFSIDSINFIYRLNGATSSVLCNNTLLTKSGINSCNTTGNYGDLSVDVYSTTGGITTLDYSQHFAAIDNSINGTTPNLGPMIGDKSEQSIWSFLIVGVCGTLGFVNPIAAIIGVILGLIVIFYLNLLTVITFSALVTITILGIALGLAIHRKRRP